MASRGASSVRHQKVESSRTTNVETLSRPGLNSGVLKVLPPLQVPYQTLRQQEPRHPDHSCVLVALDLLCLLLVSIPTILTEKGVWVPRNLGFYCNDASIQYPLVTRYLMEDSTITALGFVISICTICVGEAMRLLALSPRPPALAAARCYLGLLYPNLRPFLFGGLAGCSVAAVAKITVGRLRPHFLATCRPYLETFVCPPRDSVTSGYLTNYSCTGPPEEIREARKSFYSQNASFGMYSMLYLALYLRTHKWGRPPGRIWLLRPTLQLFLLALGLLAGLVRVMDYSHHPEDTICGYLQGGLMACWVTFYMSTPPAKRSAS